MIFILIKASMPSGKPSFLFDSRQQGGMGQNFNRCEPSLRISLAEHKAKSKKMSPTDPFKEEEKAEAKVEIEPRSEKEEENLGKASPKDIDDTHLLPYSASILVDLPDKIDDPGVSTISCLIGTQKFDQAQ
jgi:hypothetical protein